MIRLLYEAMGVTKTRFSLWPSPWWALMASTHKELDVTCVFVKLSDKDPVPFFGQARIPVFIDDEALIRESWCFVFYLEETYLDCLWLFGDPGDRAHAWLIHDWAEYARHYGGLVQLILRDAIDTPYIDDRVCCHRTHKATYGMALEAI